MRYKLRTLLIVLALGPPVLALGWWGYGKWLESRETHGERFERLRWQFEREGGSVPIELPS